AAVHPRLYLDARGMLGVRPPASFCHRAMNSPHRSFTVLSPQSHLRSIVPGAARPYRAHRKERGVSMIRYTLDWIRERLAWSGCRARMVRRVASALPAVGLATGLALAPRAALAGNAT